MNNAAADLGGGRDYTSARDLRCEPERLHGFRGVVQTLQQIWASGHAFRALQGRRSFDGVSNGRNAALQPLRRIGYQPRFGLGLLMPCSCESVFWRHSQDVTTFSHVEFCGVFTFQFSQN